MKLIVLLDEGENFFSSKIHEACNIAGVSFHLVTEFRKTDLPLVNDLNYFPKQDALFRCLSLLRDASLLTEALQPNVPWSKAAIIVSAICSYLEIRPCWACFERFWGHSNLRQCFNDTMNKNKNASDFYIYVSKTLKGCL